MTNEPSALSPHPMAADAEDLALTLIASRHNVSPRRLGDPAPSDEQLHRLLAAADAGLDDDADAFVTEGEGELVLHARESAA